jgi:hypothetical protein
MAIVDPRAPPETIMDLGIVNIFNSRVGGQR